MMQYYKATLSFCNCRAANRRTAARRPLLHTCSQRACHAAQQRGIELRPRCNGAAQAIDDGGPHIGALDHGLGKGLIELRLGEHTGGAANTDDALHRLDPCSAGIGGNPRHNGPQGAQIELVFKILLVFPT